MLGFVKRLFRGAPSRHLQPESCFSVMFDEESVTCKQPDGSEETVKWDNLSSVVVETNDTGPLGCDVFYRLTGRSRDSECVIPQGANGEQELVERLQQLPEFDNGALIEAMCSFENRRFVCWKSD